MALKQSEWAKGRKHSPVSREAGGVVVETFEIQLDSAPALGDVLEIGVLPAEAVPVDMVLIADDLDSGATPTISLDVGMVSGDAGVVDDARTCGAEFFTGSTLAQAGGVARLAQKTGFLVAKSDNHRGIGVKIAAAAATFQAGKLRLQVAYTQ